ncbi:MAG: type III-A CRISPR-associated protein Cas10/Csm1 [bacterium]
MKEYLCPKHPPKHPNDDGYSHKHTLWTNEFFEPIVSNLPPEINKTDVVNLSSYHHKPATDLQTIIQEADCLSAGVDRTTNDEEDEQFGKDAYKKRRLRAIFEQIELNYPLKRDEKGNLKNIYRYELLPLNLQKQTIFPKKQSKLSPPEGELLINEYNNLWKGFIKEFNQLPVDNFDLFFNSLYYLLQKYTWCIPASTIDFPDVSLFDHLKTTAAISGCLYKYHLQNESFNEQSIKNRDVDKYLLVCGDISGIQQFIYKISSKGAAKGLKGRSFYLQILPDAIAHHILHNTGYHIVNLLYSGGGKFYLLLDPNSENTLKDIGKEVNTYLLEQFQGGVYLALGWCHLKGSDFAKREKVESEFYLKWQESTREANKKKRQKFSEFLYNEVFGIFGEGAETKTCEICKNEIVENETKCPACVLNEKIGTRLAKVGRGFMLETYNQEKEIDEEGFIFELLGIKYYLISKDEINNIRSEHAMLYTINTTDMSFIRKDITSGFKFIAGNFAPSDKEGNILTFGELAQNSSGGLKRLGILRMDVDNLGQIFIKGLGKKASISRVTELSRKLELFFGGYLNEIVQQQSYDNKVYIVYSGGDDLFIVGAWDVMPELAREIQQEFKTFTCSNPNISLSGGITLIPGKYPIYKGAELAGESEEDAKNYKRNGKEKDALSFLNTVVSWNEFEVAYAIKDMLVKSIKEGKIDNLSGENVYLKKGILERLRQIYLLYQKNKNFWETRQTQISQQEMQERIYYNQWLWMMVYSLERYREQNKLFQEEVSQLIHAILGKEFNGIKSDREVIDFINLPAQWAEFLVREEG